MVGRMAKGRTSVILYLSRPVRAFIAKFSFAILILLCLFILFIGKVDSPFTHNVRMWMLDQYTAVAQFIAIPVQAVSFTKEGVGDYFFVHSKNELLKQENGDLRKKLSILSQVKVENDHLRSLLNFVKDRPYTHLSVRVVGDASGPFLRSIIINAGENKQVKIGQAVVDSQGLVGRVMEVGQYSARVSLLNDIHSRIPVISSLSRQRSIMVGNNKNNPKLIYLPNDTSLLEGEEILTSGDGDLFPANIPIGLAYVDDSGAFMVKPYAKWKQLEWLSILLLDDAHSNAEDNP